MGHEEPLRRIVKREVYDDKQGGRVFQALRLTLDCGHTQTVAPSCCPPTRQRRRCWDCVTQDDMASSPWRLVAEGIYMRDDDRSPSQVTDDYWVWARRSYGDYPPSTARGGKWLLFIPNEQIDAAWATIKQATEEGRLGPRAKVATARPNPHARDPHRKVICVYTSDGDDRDDVGRVLRELRALGFGGRLFWKADAATLAGIYSGAGRRASRYSSTDFEPGSQG